MPPRLNPMLPPAPEILLPPSSASDGLRRMSGSNPPPRGHPINHHVTGATPSPRTEISLGARAAAGNGNGKVIEGVSAMT